MAWKSAVNAAAAKVARPAIKRSGQMSRVKPSQELESPILNELLLLLPWEEAVILGSSKPCLWYLLY